MFWMHKGFEHVSAIKNLIYDQATYAFTPITYYCKRQSNPISEIQITPNQGKRKITESQIIKFSQEMNNNLRIVLLKPTKVEEPYSINFWSMNLAGVTCAQLFS